jgi:hypothetical protein
MRHKQRKSGLSYGRRKKNKKRNYLLRKAKRVANEKEVVRPADCTNGERPSPHATADTPPVTQADEDKEKAEQEVKAEGKTE